MNAIRPYTALIALGAAAAALAGAPAELTRPADLDRWITLGSTVRTSKQDHAAAAQLRHVRIDPKALDVLLTTGSYPDGARLAASFHPLSLDKSHDPPLFASQPEQALAIEIIDRGVPDGRVFYLFTKGAATAKAMPQGNECAVCHNARGTLDGTFADLYPLIAKLAKPAKPAKP
jgi:hypothetical protein